MEVYIVKKIGENDFFYDEELIVALKCRDDNMMFCLPQKVYLMEGHYETMEKININQLNM